MSVEYFKKQLRNKGISLEIILSKEDTHTAIQAAEVHKVPVSNIVKSLLVKNDEYYEIHLVPGDKRLELKKNTRMANAEEVKEITGYSIGGVPPFGHKEKIDIVMEEGFDKESLLVAAAGSANSVFKISFDELKRILSSL